MDRAHAGAWGLIAVIGIVALLGYQQYRWIDRVVDVEEATNREKLAESLKAFGGDFNTETREQTRSFAAWPAARKPMFSRSRASAGKCSATWRNTPA
jgi:hypothetical protein